MAFLAPLLGAIAAPILGSLLGGGSAPSQTQASQSSGTPTETLSYTAPAIAAAPGFTWQGAAGQWEAIGIALVAILFLGLFEPTRGLAIAIALLLGITLVLGKVG